MPRSRIGLSFVPRWAWAAALGMMIALCLPTVPAMGQDTKTTTNNYNFDEWDEDEESSDAPEELPPEEKAINNLVEHFVRMYGEHLKSRDWIARSMAVIGLAQIDDPRTTARLIEVLDNDGSNMVRLYAWEALFARYRGLTTDQKAACSAGGKRLYDKGFVHGDLRVGLVRIMGAEGPSAQNKAIFDKLFWETNSLNPADMRTLYAMRETLIRWKSPDIVRGLILAMNELDTAYRAEYVLGGLETGIPSARSLADKGSKVMWEETHQAWDDWYNSTTKLVETEVKPTRIQGIGSMLMERPEKIYDAADEKWRKNLELAPLNLRSLDVVFCVDSTGSMGSVIRWIQAKVIKMMRAFAVISRQPRIGIVFYRDHGDEYVVKPVPLTGNAEALSRAIEDVEAHGGADVPEAVYEAILTAVKSMKWVSDNKIIIVAGDAPPHAETMDKCTKFVRRSLEAGFKYHFMKTRTQYGSDDLSAFDSLADTGKGSATWVDFYGDPGPVMGTPGGVPAAGVSRHDLTRIAWPDQTINVDRQVMAAVLKSVTDPSYHDRAEPFANVLLEYVEKPVPEERKAFDPKPPETHGAPAGRRPRVEQEPVDPQRR